MNEQVQIQSDILLKLNTNPELFTNSLNVALINISKNAIDALGVDRVTMWQLDRTRNVFTCLQCYETASNLHTSGDVLQIVKYPKFIGALNSQQTLAVSDVTKDARTSELKDDYWKIHHITASLIVPLRITGNIDGMTCFEVSNEKRTWKENEIAFACQLTDLVAKIMLNDEIKKKDHQLVSLHITSTDTIARYSLYKLLTGIVEKATQLLGGSYGMLYLFENGQREARCVVSYNTPKDYTGLILKHGEGAVGEATRTNQPIIIDDYRRWPNRVFAFEEDKPFISMICAPMIARNEIIGAIQVIHKDEDRRFSESDKKILSIVASQTAIAIEYNHMYNQTQRQHNFLQLLNRITTTAMSALTLTDLVEISLEQTLSALNQPIGALKISDISSVRGLSMDAGKVMSDGLHALDDKFTTTLYVADWREERGSFTSLAPIMQKFGIRGSLITPVVSLGRNIGCLCVSTTTPHPWSQEEIELISMVGKHLSLSTERIQLSRSATTQADLTSKLKNISATLNRLYSFDEAIKIIGQGVIDLTNNPYAAIYLGNPDGTVNCRWFNKLSSTHIKKVESAEGRELAHVLNSTTRPTLIPDLNSPGINPTLKDFFTAEGFKSIALYPIIYEEQVMGTIGTFYTESRTWPQNTQDLMMGFANQAASTLQNAYLYKQLEEGYVDMALALANAMDRRETMLTNYSKRLADWSEKTARALGCTEQEISDIRWAAMLHDIGKTAVPDEVLQKPGPLTREEWEIVQKHPLRGEAMIQPIARFNNVGSIIRSFRERYDGKGYPNQLRQDQIPLGARILAVADAYGSIIDQRPYKPPRPPEEAIIELQNSSGQQFDPIVVNAFLSANKGIDQQL